MLFEDDRDVIAESDPCPACGDEGAAPPRRLSHQADKAALLRRLRRIEGQVRGLQRMIEMDRYCIDVLVQIGAVKAAIDRVALALMEAHVRGCVHDAIRGGRGEASIDELMDALKGLLK